MAQFRKKPVVIDAVRLDLSDRQSTRAALEAIGATPGEFDMPVIAGKACWWKQTYPADGGEPSYQLVIATLEGEMTARDGDYIIRGVKGEIYPCRPDIFEATYEAVEDHA